METTIHRLCNGPAKYPELDALAERLEAALTNLSLLGRYSHRK